MRVCVDQQVRQDAGEGGLGVSSEEGFSSQTHVEGRSDDPREVEEDVGDHEVGVDGVADAAQLLEVGEDGESEAQGDQGHGVADLVDQQGFLGVEALSLGNLFRDRVAGVVVGLGIPDAVWQAGARRVGSRVVAHVEHDSHAGQDCLVTGQRGRPAHDAVVRGVAVLGSRLQRRPWTEPAGRGDWRQVCPVGLGVLAAWYEGSREWIER